MGGSVRRRGGRWEYRFDAGTDPITGRRSRPGRSGLPTREAAEQALRLAQEHRACATQTAIADPRANLTLLAYLTAWLTETEPTLRPATTVAYGRYIAAHVGPTIGTLRLRDLTATHLNQLYAHLLQDGHLRRDGGLSPKSVANIHRMLHRALSCAVRSGVVDRSVLDQAVPPPLPHPHPAGTADEPFSPTSGDREAATHLASLMLGTAQGREGRDMDAGTFTQPTPETKNPPTKTRVRRSAGPSTSSGSGI